MNFNGALRYDQQSQRLQEMTDKLHARINRIWLSRIRNARRAWNFRGQLQKLKEESNRPKRIHLTELPETGERDDNTYLTLHDHYIQTGKLRARIKELEMQLAEATKSPID